MRFIIDTLIIILNPRNWIMNDKYSFTWDSKLNLLLDKYDFKDINEYTAKLNNEEIWIANHPYASFTKYSLGYDRKRPSRYTILKAKRKLEYDRQYDKLTPEQKIAQKREDRLKMLGL